MDRDLPGGKVDSFNPPFAGGASNFHDKGERCGVELAVEVGVEDHVKADVGKVLPSFVTVCYRVDGVLGVKGCGV